MRLAWTTDIHLDCVTDTALHEFAGRIRDLKPDMLLIGGDIATAADFDDKLIALHRLTRAPISFVLGNHDYYGSNIKAVRRRAAALSHSPLPIDWLPGVGAVSLSSATTLIGHGGWSDGMLGDFLNSTITLNDYVQIEDLQGLDKHALLQKLSELGFDAAHNIRASLEVALHRRRKNIMLLTHVPPYRGACWYQGQVADDNWLPHFSCGAVGKTILSMMRQHPDTHLTVLCGHTHNSGRFQPLDNLVVLTGGATYGKPAVVQTFEID